MSDSYVDRVYDGATESLQWLRGVIFGEWEDNRSLSQIVTDALAGFVPGLGSIITLRDLLAVIFRLAKYPEKREHVEEWILLIAMLLPLVVTVLGAVVAGVGALVGAEVGGFLRALTLFLVKKGGVAFKAMIEFFQAHGYGNVIAALKQVKFARYREALAKEFDRQIDKLVDLLKKLEKKLEQVHADHLPSWMPGVHTLRAAPGRIRGWIHALTELKDKAVSMIPKALIELDNRLAALLAGNLKAATQVAHAVATGQAAPEVARLEKAAKEGELARNAHPPEPGNTRRIAERRSIALAGKREYEMVGKDARPVGAKPYEHGVTKMENPAVAERQWGRLKNKVKEGYPDLNFEYAPTQFSKDYANFSRSLRTIDVPAGSKIKFKRVVSHDKPSMDTGPYYNRELPVDGEDLRAGSAVKEGWNKNGEYIQLSTPPKGDPVWKELHALREQAAGGPVPYSESLKGWEGPAASQRYVVDEGLPTQHYDSSYLVGGKEQQFFDRKEIALLKERGFVSERKPTNFPDFDKELGNIVPKDGPALHVIPAHEAVPKPH